MQWNIHLYNRCTKSCPTSFNLLWVPHSGSLHSGFSSAFEAVVPTTHHFENTTLTTCDTHGVTEHVEGDFVHLLCIYSIAK
jgi:hypothetical protein